MASTYNISVDQGADFNTTVTLTDSNNSALDLDNYSVRAQIRKYYTSRSATDFTVAIDSPASAGKTTLSLTATQSANIEPGRYVYDLEIESGTSVVTRVLEGIVTVFPGVTREAGRYGVTAYGSTDSFVILEDYWGSAKLWNEDSAGYIIYEPDN